MARKITNEAIAAFNQNRPFCKSNTCVMVESGTTFLMLFGSDIAIKENGVLKITNAGWQTKTTMERLNALPGVRIQQKKGVWYLNGEIWDGSWKVING